MGPEHAFLFALGAMAALILASNAGKLQTCCRRNRDEEALGEADMGQTSSGNFTTKPRELYYEAEIRHRLHLEGGEELPPPYEAFRQIATFAGRFWRPALTPTSEKTLIRIASGQVAQRIANLSSKVERNLARTFS